MTLETLSRSEDGIAADRSWFDDSLLPMWICDVDTLEFLEVNEAALDHYGYTREEFLARKVFDLHHPGNGRAGEPIASMSRGFRCSITRKDGTIVPLEIACSPIQHAERTAFFAIVRDAEPMPATSAADSPAVRSESAPEGIGSWEWNIETGALVWSAEVYRMFGIPRDQPLTFPDFMDCVVAEDRAQLQQVLDASLRTHRPFAAEYRVRDTGSSHRLLAASGVVMVDPQGRAVRLVGTVQDVTAASLEHRFSHLGTQRSAFVEVSPVGIFHTGPDGRCDYVNTSYCEMSGLSRDEALGDGWVRALHSADRDRVAVEWARAVAGRLPYRSECRLVRPGRREIWVVAQAVPEAQGREPTGYLGTITDITDRKHAEEALEQERRRLQALFDCIQDAIVLTNDDLLCVDVNPAACQLLGSPREDLLGRDIQFAMPCENRSAPRASRRYFLERGRTEGEFELLRRDGTRCAVEYRAVATVIPGLHLTVLRDVSARSTSESMLRAHARHQAALAILGQKALAGMEHGVLLEEATRRSVDALEAQHGMVTQFVSDSDQMTILTEQVEGGGEHERRTIDRVPLAADCALRTDGPVLIADLGTETRFTPDPLLLDLGLTSGIRVIIPGRERAFGVLAIHTREPRAFTQDDVHFLQSVANLVALAGIRIDEQEMRNRLLGRIVAARDEERQRLARELHDETGQSLTALLVGLVSVEQSRTIEDARSLAMQLRQITARTIEDLGRLARGLHPSILTDMGLAEAARRHVADFQRSCGMPVELRIRGLDGPRLRSRLESTCYRVLQEALTNYARHSRASHARVRLFRSGREVVLVVKDDGAGFDVGSQLARLSPSSGLGLHGMRERVARAGGIMTIDSAPHAGTRLIVRIPIRPNRMANHRTESSQRGTEASS